MHSWMMAMVFLLPQAGSPYAGQQARALKALSAEEVAAHLETKAALTPAQVVQYDRLRGYGEDGGSHEHRHH